MRKSSWATTTTLKSSGTEVLKGGRGKERKVEGEEEGGRERGRKRQRKGEEPVTISMACRGDPDGWRHISFRSDRSSHQRGTLSVPAGCVMGGLSKVLCACAENCVLCRVLPNLAFSICSSRFWPKFALPRLTLPNGVFVFPPSGTPPAATLRVR